MSTHSSGETWPVNTPGAVNVSFDGRPLAAVSGQNIGAALVSNGITAWRSTRKNARPRGLFCGIGVCFDCIVTVNGERDVRACQRRAVDGDGVESQHDTLPEASA